MKINNILNYNFLFILLFLIGLILRNYNINFDDLWVDEMSTFWIANPNIDILTSYKNNSTLELQPSLFNFIVRFFFQIIGYNDDYARYVPSFFSVLSIISVSYISWLISENKSYLLTAFLISCNIYLISYAQELRVYSTVFFFISLSIIFYFQSLKKEKFLNIFFFNIFILFSILIHPFSLILLFSIILHIILFLIFKNKVFKRIIISVISIFFLSIIYYFIHLKNLIPDSSNAYFFLKNPDLKFLTNLFFSKFFGSRIIGVFFLILFLFAIKKSFRKMINLEEISFLLIFFAFSYIVPIIYGFLFHPIIAPKYIIFVIIPIVVIISNFIFDLKRKNRLILITLLSLVTILNLFTEQTVKQFFYERSFYKPQVTNSLTIINNSDYKDYFIKVEPYNEDVKIPWTYAVENYFNYLIKKENLHINQIKKIQHISEYTWIICIHDLNHFGCNVDGTKKVNKIDLNRVSIILVSK